MSMPTMLAGRSSARTAASLPSPQPTTRTLPGVPKRRRKRAATVSSLRSPGTHAAAISKPMPLLSRLDDCKRARQRQNAVQLSTELYREVTTQNSDLDDRPRFPAADSPEQRLDFGPVLCGSDLYV